MNKFVSRKSFILLGFVSFCVLGVWTFSSYENLISVNDKNEKISSSEGVVKADETLQLAPAYVPGGWKTYVSGTDWMNKGQVSFSYPPDWTLKEEHVTVFQGQPREYVRLEKIILTGGGYKIEIHQHGREASLDWTSVDVDGHNARMWESEYETAEGVLYSTLVGGMNVGFVIQLNTYYKDKQPFEEFIRTIKFRYP